MKEWEDQTLCQSKWNGNSVKNWKQTLLATRLQQTLWEKETWKIGMYIERKAFFKRNPKGVVEYSVTHKSVSQFCRSMEEGEDRTLRQWKWNSNSVKNWKQTLLAAHLQQTPWKKETWKIGMYIERKVFFNGNPKGVVEYSVTHKGKRTSPLDLRLCVSQLW